MSDMSRQPPKHYDSALAEPNARNLHRDKNGYRNMIPKPLLHMLYNGDGHTIYLANDVAARFSYTWPVIHPMLGRQRKYPSIPLSPNSTGD